MPNPGENVPAYKHRGGGGGGRERRWAIWMEPQDRRPESKGQQIYLGLESTPKRTCTQIVDLAARERRHLHARHGFVLWVVVVDEEGRQEAGGRRERQPGG